LPNSAARRNKNPAFNLVYIFQCLRTSSSSSSFCLMLVFFLLHFYLCVVPQRYCRGTFSEKRVPTIGTDFLSKRIEIRGEVNFVLVI